MRHNIWIEIKRRQTKRSRNWVEYGWNIRRKEIGLNLALEVQNIFSFECVLNLVGSLPHVLKQEAIIQGYMVHLSTVALQSQRAVHAWVM